MITSVKSKVFNYLTKAQKSELCHFLSKFTQKNKEKTAAEIAEKFLEDERYYLDINSSRHPWIDEYLDDELFYKEINDYIKDQLLKYAIKERQKPYIEKQKELAKAQRKQAKEFKMSKEPPTKAQMSYYKSLCKKYNLNQELDENSSKLDYKNAISKILETYSDKEDILKKLNEIIR